MNNKKYLGGGLALLLIILLAYFLVRYRMPENNNSLVIKKEANSFKQKNSPKNNLLPFDSSEGSITPPQKVIKENEIPKQALVIKVDANGFNPQKIKVKAGQNVTLSISSSDDNSHMLLLSDPSLAALTAFLAPHETKLINFKIMKPGTYDFVDNMPEYNSHKGEIIVQ